MKSVVPAAAGVLLAAAGALLGPAASAQDYPTRQVTLMITTGPGGGTDAIARMLANALTASLKQPVIAVNRPGANGVIASEALVRSAPDGYTLLVIQNGHTVNPATVRKLPYDTFKDFTAITSLGRSPMVLVAGAHTGVRNLREMREFGRRTPNGMTFGAPDTTSRLASELITSGAGVGAVYVNYKGSGAAMSDLAGGHLNFQVTSMPSTLPLHAAGRLHYVGLLAPKRSPLLPDIASMAEQGLPDIEYTGWWAVVGPAGMPAPLVKRISSAIHAALEDPEMKKRMASLYMEPWPQSPEEFDNFLRKDAELNLKLARKARIEPE